LGENSVMTNSSAASLAVGITFVVLGIGGLLALNSGWTDAIDLRIQREAVVERVDAETLMSTATYKSYDWEASKDKLRRIGQAISLYREEYPPQPISKRANHRDAGLPNRLDGLLEPGHKWSLTKDSLFLTQVSQQRGRRNSDFVELAWYTDRRDSFGFEWSERGDKIPILLDLNMYEGSNLFRPLRGDLDVLCLRLDGTIDRIKFEPFDYTAVKRFR
jgi:hypothetical protein